MADQNPAKAVTADTFEWVSAKITSDKFESGVTLNILPVITDIDIYEHIEKPYLTGNIFIGDSTGLLDYVGFKGFEKLELVYKSPYTSNYITKNFVIVEITKTQKDNDAAEFISLSLVEDFAYINGAMNVNKSYEGPLPRTISNILSQYLDVTLLGDVSTSSKQSSKVIIPNMRPLDACKWLTSKLITSEGLPYFLFSTLASGEENEDANQLTRSLQLRDLGSMLSDNALYDKEFTYLQGYDQRGINVDHSGFNIISYSHKNSSNLYNILTEGYVGSLQQFYNIDLGTTKRVFFNVQDQAFEPLVRSGVLKTDQVDTMYSENYLIDEEPAHERTSDSKIITRIGAAPTYIGAKNIHEEFESNQYKLKVVGNALKRFLVKDPITIIVPCKNFIYGGDHLTIGRIIKIKFLSSRITEAGVRPIKDKTKSGEYMIYSARHMIKRQKYNIVLTCVKLAEPESERE